MPSNDLMKPIEISSVSQALDALRRSKGSFEEWLDCARIFAANRMWNELEISARKAMEAATNRPIKPILLREAAMRFAAGSLKSFSSESEFAENLKKIILALRQFSKTLPADAERLSIHFDPVIEAIDEITILLSDGTPPALVSIASKLRKKIGRPDLAIKVASVAIHQNSELCAAYTARGSAFTEMEEFNKALDDFLVAETNNKCRRYALAGHTKLLLMQGKFRSALNLGSELLKGTHTKPMLFMLAAAAKGAEDEAKFQWLVKQSEALPDVPSGTGKILLLRQSIKILIQNMQFDIAEALLNQLEKIDKPIRIRYLRTQIDKAKNYNKKP